MNILMITIGFPPRQVGGTETYVLGLIDALKPLGHQCSVAYMEPFEDPSDKEFKIEKDSYEGIPIHRVLVNRAHNKTEMVGLDPQLHLKIVEQFKKVVAIVKPDIVHLHPLRLGMESHLLEALNNAGWNVVMTHHSSTTTCARGDLLYMGKDVCDGLMIRTRCTKCMLNWKAVPSPIAAIMAGISLSWYRRLFRWLEGKQSLKRLRSLVSMPLLLDESFRNWLRAYSNTRRYVTVCNWVKEVALMNGVPEKKIVYSRHGLRLVGDHKAAQHNGVTRFGYLGRISPEKGIELLVNALRRMSPEAKFEFEFCSFTFNDSRMSPEQRAEVEAVKQLVATDKRIRIINSPTDSNLASVLATWDALVVPSFWLESGPEVIYEAFAVKTPAIGSRRGGIAELVEEGKSGFLFSPTNVDELTSLLTRFASDPSELRAMRNKIGPVRTTTQVAEEMEQMYRAVAAGQ